MAILVRFPKVGENIEEGMVGAWRKREGELVAKGEALAELITDKAAFDFESPAEGVLFRVLAPEKSTVPIQYILAIVGADGAALVERAEREKEQLLAAWRARATPRHDRGSGAPRCRNPLRRGHRDEAGALPQEAAANPRVPMGEGTAQWDFQKGLDGMICTYLGKTNLVCIDPEDAPVEVLGKVEREGKIAFFAKDIYLAGDEQIRRLANIAE